MMEIVNQLANPPKNIKLHTTVRDSKYHVLRDQDESGLFGQREAVREIFCMAFAIGYYFNEQKPIGKGSINHVNIVSLDLEFKQLATLLILKRKPDITDPKELWKEIEIYAEYGIEVLFNSWKDKGILDIADIFNKQ